jgi:GNAT superfamily N-acetyltransferase
MSSPRRSSLRKRLHLLLRRGLALLPRAQRFALVRRMVDCDPSPDPRLLLKVAETREELEACFKILHDAYVAAGFMQAHPSGLRATLYHALPTTTTLCAKWEGRVVGTISMIRDGVFGFPMQQAFDLSGVRALPGQIAEISALAVHPDFRQTGGAILFPLMKFMYEYCVRYFDTRHLVIAVNPDRIEMYEALLLFKRLAAQTVDAYDFANGAPAVGATLDLRPVKEQLRRVYGVRPGRKNLYDYFIVRELPNIQWPRRRYRTTNDAVMTPALLDHFFNQRTQAFAGLDDRKKALLWSIYQQAEYRQVLPMLAGGEVPSTQGLRRHARHSVLCPAQLHVVGTPSPTALPAHVIELSFSGCQLRVAQDLPPQTVADATVSLGEQETSQIHLTVVRHVAFDGEYHVLGCHFAEGDDSWRRCVAALESGLTAADVHAH